MFYEYYRKKCPYKDQVETGLEFIMKKFSDSALVTHKSMINKKENQIDSLKTKNNQLSNEFLNKDEKIRNEKAQLQEKNAKLESKLEELTNQNKHISSNLKILEEEMELKVRMA